MSLVLAVAALLALGAAVAPRGRVAAWLVRLRPGRDRALRAELPALIDGLAAALASGLSLPVAVAEIAPTLQPELARCTRRASASLALGARVPDALAWYAPTVPPDDVAPLGVVLDAFARSGGRVGASLHRVAALLRGRLALEDERAALTAQARVSAAVLVALAPIGAVFFSLAMPDYLAVLAGDGRILLGAACLFEALGVLWLWRIVRSARPGPDLASFLDAMVVGLDAGLTFERALSAFVQRAPGFARASDARRLLADLALGVPLTHALGTFARGPDEARVAALVAASTRFGSPLAALLVVQTDAIRTAARNRAEADARRLPVLMLFPLALCILPALLVVFLGPPLLALLR